MTIFTLSAVGACDVPQDNLTVSDEDCEILEMSQCEDVLNTDLSEDIETQQNTIVQDNDVLQLSINKSDEVLTFSTSKIYLWFTEEPYLELDGETDLWILNEKREEFPIGSSIKVIAKDLNTGVTYKDSLPTDVFPFEYGNENVHYMVGLSLFKKIPLNINHKYKFKVYYVSPGGKSTYLGKSTLKVKKIKRIAQLDFTTHIYANQKISATLYKSNGNFASNIDATLYINGKQYQTVKTNSKGVAIFDLPNKVGRFRYWVEADKIKSGYDSILKINHCLKISKVNVKKSAKKLTVKVSLKKINGKFLKGGNITLKFNKKVYISKTNKHGVAKFTIKKSILKKLKVGKKVKIKAYYLKDHVKTTVKVQK